MSWYEFDGKEEYKYVVLGWDDVIGKFFFQLKSEVPDPDIDMGVVYINTTNNDPEILVDRASGCADIPDDMVSKLLADKERERTVEERKRERADREKALRDRRSRERDDDERER